LPPLSSADGGMGNTMEVDMETKEFEAIIHEHGGVIQPAINWIWAVFEDDEKGHACFEKLKDHCEHRGYYEGNPQSTNPNARLGGFRFR
jgi:hypothetical protein